MLEDLFRAIEKMEEEEDAWDASWVSIDQVSIAEDVIELLVGIHVPTNEPSQTWRIVAREPPAYRLGPLAHGSVVLHSDHAALWPYTKPRCSIYITGRVPDPAPLLGRLLDAHREMVGDWWPIDSFINSIFLTTSPELWNPAYGYFSLGGPEPLIREYMRVLETFGLGASIPEESPHYASGGKSRLAKDRALPMYVLDIGGSYVIASDFHAERVS